MDSYRLQRWTRSGIGYLLLLAVIALIGLPLLWMLSGAIKDLKQINTFPPVWIPANPRWHNFADAWRAAPFARFYFNSVLTTAVATAVKLFNAILSAYALAYLAFPKKNLVFIVMLAALMVPLQVTILPNYLTLARANWVNTYQGIILPTVSVVFGTFLLRQHFLSLPRDVLDAARVDGAGHLRMIWSVVLPMSRPVLATIALLTIVSQWNEFLWPLVITNTVKMRTLPIGVAYLFDVEGNTQWGVVMAGTVLVVLPMIVVFLLAQRHIVEGMTAGATKG